MAKYVTYMSVTLHPDGANPTEITRVLRNLGWKPVYGGYDYAYEWDKELTVGQENFDKYCDQINTMHTSLKNMDVTYNLRTFEHGKEEFTTHYCY